MARAFYMLQWRHLDPAHKLYDAIKTYDLFVANASVDSTFIRRHIKPDALIFAAFNFYSVPQKWGNGPGNVYWEYRTKLNRNQYYYRDKKTRGRLDAGWDSAWLKPGLNIAKRQIEAMVDAQFSNPGVDGFYIDMAGDYLAWHQLYRKDHPLENHVDGLVAAGVVKESHVPYEQCRWAARGEFFFQYLRHYMDLKGWGDKFIIAQRYEAYDSHRLVHDPRRSESYARPWDQYVNGITIEKSHTNRIMHQAVTENKDPNTAVTHHWERQLEIARDIDKPSLSVDWSGRWEIPDVVMRGMIEFDEETYPPEFLPKPPEREPKPEPEPLPPDLKVSKSIDQYGRYIKDGEPFFPLGMYFGPIREEEIAEYKEAPFNCLLSYSNITQADLDLAHANDLMVIYQLAHIYHDMWIGAPPSSYNPGLTSSDDEEPAIKERVTAFKDHPALLAWYTNDEREISDDTLNHYKWVDEIDSLHPCYTVLWQHTRVKEWVGSFDVIGTDPYPIGIPDEKVLQAGFETKAIVNQMGENHPIWMVPQMWSWRANWSEEESDRKGARTPTYDEMRSMAWQCICEGANGLIAYNFYELKQDPETPFEEQWPNVKNVIREISAWIPVLLSVEKPPKAELKVDAPWLNWMIKKRNNTLYVFMTNNGDGEGAVVFEFPDDDISMPPMYLEKYQMKVYAIDLKKSAAKSETP
jgi:hypothetical protein